MNLPAYIEGLTRTAQNIPGLVMEWAGIDAELQSHYSEALIELLVMHEAAVASATKPADSSQLQRAWALFRSAVMNHARELQALMDFNPLELLAPLSVSAERVSFDAEELSEPEPALAA